LYSQKSVDKKEETVYKYSKNGKGELHEAVIIEGKPYFLKYHTKEDGTNFFQSPLYIQEETRRLLPPHIEEYPYDPYIFNSLGEPNQYLQIAKNESIDTLYQKIKSIVRKYNDIDEKTLNLISADILATYFQDRFSTVHYLIIVGDNGTGKSAIADTFAALGYRVVVMTNPTKAIWYRVLGYIEYGQVTIIADESEGIEENPEIMGILKDGYQIKRKVPRMDSDNKKPEWYYPYCMKLIICENSPTDYKAKGLLDRSFKIKTYKGSPQFDIKEVRNPQGNKIREKLLDELEDLRKVLLAFKLYHKEPLPELDIGLDGRDKELCKPLIQLFYGSESQTEIEETLQYFIDIKNERKQQTLEAVMIPVVINRVSQSGNEMSNRELFELVTSNLDGKLDDNGNVFYLEGEGFRNIYINTITKIATDKLGADTKRGTKTHSVLVFNIETLRKNAKIYGVQNKITAKPVESDSNDATTHIDACGEVASQSDIESNSEKCDNVDDLINDLQEDSDKNDDIVNQKMAQDPVERSKCVGASVNQSDEIQCPYGCDYWEKPFFMKIHLKNEHSQENDLEIRDSKLEE
jgi:hypothetical protein